MAGNDESNEDDMHAVDARSTTQLRIRRTMPPSTAERGTAIPIRPRQIAIRRRARRLISHRTPNLLPTMSHESKTLPVLPSAIDRDTPHHTRDIQGIADLQLVMNILC